MCTCLKNKATELFNNQNIPDRGRYFVLALGQLSIHKEENAKPSSPMSGSKTFDFTHCPYCGDRLEISKEQNHTSNRIYFDRTFHEFEITELIDVVSDNPADYTMKHIVEAGNEVEAVKVLAIKRTQKDSGNIIIIENIKGSLKQVIIQLNALGHCFTSITKIS